MKMKPKEQQTTKRETRSVERFDKRLQATLELLQQLAAAMVANERVQRRFRNAIISQVTKIDATVKLIHGAQIAETHGHGRSEEITKHAAAAEEFISDASRKLGLAVVNYVYDEMAEAAPLRGRKCKWSSWEI